MIGNNQIQMNEARARGRKVYGALALMSAVWGIAELQVHGDVAAFFACLYGSLLAIVVRHTLSPNGVADLLQMFMNRTRGPR